MDVVSFTVQNYRSITKAHKLPIDRSTILVGPNNEGKSNILKALVAAMQVLTKGRVNVPQSASTQGRFRHHRFYNWERDFPIGLQAKRPNGESVLILEFRLTDDEIEEFKDEIRSSLNGTLPLRLELGLHKCEVKVSKKGPGVRLLSRKSDRIAAFVADRLDFEYIPAVRTAKSAQEIVDEMVERELQAVETNPDYQAALTRVAELQQPILDKLSEAIRGTLVQFLPIIRGVNVQIATDQRYRALRRSSEIVVDDGVPTELQYKGDGAQSLAALGIMRHASERGARGRNLLIAIEEPESHLHPKAIHALKDVIQELATKHQVVITTHCPLFVDRAKLDSNIVVNNSRARAAKSIQEIRDILGVRSSDNLRHAELVLLVEGEDDRIALSALLGSASASLKQAIDHGTIAIDSLAGGANLAYKSGLVRDALCACHCFLDNDKAGIDAFDKARIQGLLGDADVNYAICPGMTESEIEDMYDVTAYESVVMNAYRVSLQCPAFKGRKKWSTRLRAAFESQGKKWDDRIEMSVKQHVAEAIAAIPQTALNAHKRSAFDALAAALEVRLQSPGAERSTD
jgi:predicted ATP-dependent endonuclease of OLD family